MRSTGLIVAATLLGLVGVWLVLSGAGRTTPSLAATVRSLRRGPATTHDRRDRDLLDHLGTRWGAPLAARLPSGTRAGLRIIDRTPERHAGLMVASALLGFVAPTVLLVLAGRIGVFDTDGMRQVVLPAGVGLIVAVLAPLVVHSAAIERAADLRLGLRHQMSAFVDMVTMLLAGNAGHEGALRDAADAGDGQLFRELRRRMREVGATGRSLIDALDLVADDFDLPELTQIAATGRLAASEGAPVARSLAAKCATLRSTLAADQEAEARVRTDKVTPPLVGMTVLFMAVIIYPALNL